MPNNPRRLASFPEVLATWDYKKNGADLHPETLSRLDDEKYPKGFWWFCSDFHSYPMSIKSRLKGSGCLVCSNKFVPGQNDLLSKFPELQGFWPREKSWEDRPTDIRIGSRDRPIDLQCPKHPGIFSIEVRSLVRYLEKSVSACETCRIKATLAGKSIEETQPNLLAIWDFKLNGQSPDLVSPGSQKRVWWICILGHDSWQASPYEVKNGWKMCPCCPGSHKLVQGCNDLATTHPEIAHRWDFQRNELAPTSVKIGMNKKFFFKCEQDPNHHPEMYLPNLKKNHQACTYCWNEPVRCGQNDFGCLFPDLVPFLVVEGTVTDPHGLRPGDERDFTWKCLKGEDHTFQRTLATMTSKRSKGTCPICTNRVIVPGLNSLRDLAPDIAEEWDAARNVEFEGLSPDTISPRSGYEVFWKCSQGHPSFRAAVWNRTVAQTGCPGCAKFGYKKSEAALLYLIERNETHLFKAARKIGISNIASSRTRLRHWSYQGFTVLHTVSHASGQLISELENILLEDWIRGQLGLGQYLSSDEILGGFTETFAPDHPSNSEVIQKINQVHSKLSAKYSERVT